MKLLFLMKPKKIMLINSKNDIEHANNLDSGYSFTHPHMGLVSIKEYVESKNRYVEVKILDDYFKPPKNLEDEVISFNADIYGFSDLFYNTINNQNLASLIKYTRPNSKIVFGNANASGFAQRLALKEYVDYVYIGNGEEFMYQLSVGNFPKRKISGFGTSQPFKTKINELPIIKLKGFEDDLKHYDSRLENYDQSNISPLSISGNRGCIKAVQEGSCTYCTEINEFIEVMNRNKYVKQLSFFYQNLGIKYFFESADSFLFGNLPEKTKDSIPDFLDGKVDFRFYGNLSHINEKSIKEAKKLGMVAFFPGIENVSEEILQRANKRYDINYNNFDDIFKKLDILEENEINFYMPILFGLAGENKRSIEKNMEFVRQVSDRYSHFDKFYCDIVVPLPGSELFDSLVKNDKLCGEYDKYNTIFTGKVDDSLKKSTMVDFTLLMKLMGKYIWKDVNFDFVLDSVRETNEIAKNKGIYIANNFGVFDFDKYKSVR